MAQEQVTPQEVQAANAAENEAAAQAATDEAAKAEAAAQAEAAKKADPAAEADAEAAKEPAKGKDGKPWYLSRIAELTAQKNRSSAEAQELRAALAAKAADPAAAAKPTVLTEDEVNRRANIKAQELALENEFNRESNKIFDAGQKEFPDWVESLEGFAALGGLPNEVIAACLELEEPHRVLHALANDPTEAQRVFKLSPIKMAVALSKMKGTQPKPTKVSEVPAPIKTIGGKNAGEKSLEDMTTAEYAAFRDKEEAEAKKKRYS